MPTGALTFVDEKTEDPAVEGHIFGKLVKRDDSMADGIIKAGYPDLFRGNIFDGVDITPYVEPGTQKRCFDGYLLFDGGLSCLSLSASSPSAPPQSNEVVTDGREAEAA